MRITMPWTVRRVRKGSSSDGGNVLAGLVALGYIPPHVGPAPSIWGTYGLTIAACIGGAILLVLPDVLGTRRQGDRDASRVAPDVN